MWRYMLFLLVNTYGGSFGIPLKTQVWNPNLLNDLANRCKNQFVLSQIAIKAKDCNVSTPVLQDVQFRCLVFYDASSLLCDIPDDTLPNLSTDFTVKTNDKQNVTSFCGESAHFDIPLTSSQNMMTQIFQNEVLCITVCVDEDLLSGDTNFVCKYYKWMLGVRQSWLTAGHETGQAAVNPAKVSTTETKGTDGKVNEVTTQHNNSSKEPKEPESDANKVDIQVNANSTSTQNSNVAPVISGVDHATEQLSGIKTQQNNATLKDHNSGEVKVDKPVDTNNHLNPETGADSENDLNGGSNKDFVIEHPQLNAGDDDDNGDPGLDGGQDNNDDTIDGDGDDSDDHLGEIDTRPQNEKNTGNSGIRVETQMTYGEASQKDIFPNAISDAFQEDDDHFFPFFLTAVIVVVVLYVLYHNKNKVGKMFFGLIVEGRQPGRRRNSRGHSYRRLDTLEQAMSANTTAPPSKIIY